MIKNKKITKLVLFGAILIISQSSIFAASKGGPSTSAFQLAVNAFDAAHGYESAAQLKQSLLDYGSGISLANSSIASGNYAKVIEGLQTAAKANLYLTANQLLNGEKFSLANLQKAGFTGAQIQAIGEAAGLNESGAILYANTGLSDNNYNDIITMFNNGLQSADSSLVTNALKLLNADDYPNDPLLQSLVQELSDPSSVLNENLSADFSPEEIKGMFQAAGIDPKITQAVFETNQWFIDTMNGDLADAFTTGDFTSMNDIIDSFKSLRPIFTAELFGNGNPLSYESFKQYSKFTDDEITQIATSAGLSSQDIANYKAGNYPTSSSGGNSKKSDGGAENRDIEQIELSSSTGNTYYDDAYNQAVANMNNLNLNNTDLVNAIQSFANSYQQQIINLQDEISKASGEELTDLQNQLKSTEGEYVATQDYLDKLQEAIGT